MVVGLLMMVLAALGLLYVLRRLAPRTFLVLVVYVLYAALSAGAGVVSPGVLGGFTVALGLALLADLAVGLSKIFRKK